MRHSMRCRMGKHRAFWPWTVMFRRPLPVRLCDAARRWSFVTPARILVAEDEEVVRRVLARTLEDAGYLVVAVENGWEAWRQVQNEPFDLLVTDHVMPLLGGKKLVEQVRGLNPAMPVILVSGNFIKGDTPGEYPTDVVMLAKPFQNEVLVRAVKDLLGVAKASPAKDPN